VVRHALLTTFVLDVVGFALSSHEPQQRINWCKGKRDEVPNHKHNRLFNKRTSFNSYFLVHLLRLFCESNPVELEDIHLVVDDIEDFIAKFGKESKAERVILGNKLDDHNTGKDTGLILIVAVSVAIYSLLVEGSSLFFFMFADAVFDAFGFDQQTKQLGMFVAFNVYQLAHTGYFCIEHLEDCFQYNVVPDMLSDRLTTLKENGMNVQFLKQRCDLVGLDGYSTKIVMEVMHVMMRISTGYTGGIKTTPREQLAEIFTSDSNPEDIGFLYGMVCMASEQEHPLVTRILREGVEYRKAVDDTLRFF
jgi:hypothetical protein